ncbi:hypothetical protein HCN44_002879 [Aphidius gifuensis]|uniref:Sphingomyelin phosphodiesterase n=1 Tax=Aphidius gifuensis TaxID=684658 RepID=A0A834XRR1_APHGI|nr:hypothetical protein HCN44_002879 [Aphidius gifuensis]
MVDDEVNCTLISNEIENWATIGIKTKRFNNIMNDLSLPSSWQKIDWTNFVDGIKSTLLCTICKSVAKSIINLHRTGVPDDKLKKTITELCVILNIQSEAVCQGVVSLNLPIFLYIIDHDSTINHNDICGLVLQNQDCTGTIALQRYEWSINVDKNNKRFVNKKLSKQRYKILQVTDIHYDPLYEANGSADCNEPTCCRKGQYHINDQPILAGYWGDFNNCDSPWHAVTDALDNMASQHKDIDYVYFTGDIIDHGIWQTSRQGNTESLIKTFNKIIDTFNDTPVYPILGNHEPHPLNLFSPDSIVADELSTKWLYKLMADTWINAGWLPESTRQTIQRGGYYTVVPRNGLRVIALNNNIAYILNWWLIYEPEDPNGQLKWLNDVLREAEDRGEAVHLLAHVPSGSIQIQHTWSREYNKIINRFSHIIAAQFNGHTHNDELNLIFNDDKQVINVAWNGGSITPYAFLNSNYKVYTVNADSFAIENFDNWMYNLTEANLTPNKSPNWFKSYSFKEEYNLQDLSYESLNNWLLNMTKNVTLQQQYRRNFHKNASPELDKYCDEECLRKIVCQIVTGKSDDDPNCEYFKNL